MKKLFALLLAGALCLSLASCKNKPKDDSSKDSSSDTTTYKIAALFPEDNAAAQQTLAGCLAGAKEQGKSISMAPSYGDAAAEAKKLSSLTPQNHDGLVALPVAGEVSVAELSRAAAKGVPVALVNVAISDNDFAVSAAYTTEYNLGAAAGKAAKAYIEANLSGKADIVILEHTPKNRNENIYRINGFLDQFKDMPNVKPVRDMKSATTEEMKTHLDDYFKAAGDKAAQIIFCTNADAIMASQNAVTEAKLIGKTVVFGTELTKEITEVLQGEGCALQAVAVADYWQMGKKAMTEILSAIEAGAATAGAPSVIEPIVLKPAEDTTKEYLAKAFA